MAIIHGPALALAYDPNVIAEQDFVDGLEYGEGFAVRSEGSYPDFRAIYRDVEEKRRKDRPQDVLAHMGRVGELVEGCLDGAPDSYQKYFGRKLIVVIAPGDCLSTADVFNHAGFDLHPDVKLVSKDLLLALGRLDIIRRYKLIF